MTMLSTFMQQLGKDLELTDPLTTEVPGVYTIRLEEDLAVAITSLPEGVAFHCNVIAFPKAKEEAFLTQVLLADLFGQGTKGGVLGLNEDGNVLTLSLVMDYNIGYKEFRNLLEDFINVADFWRDEALNYR